MKTTSSQTINDGIQSDSVCRIDHKLSDPENRKIAANTGYITAWISTIDRVVRLNLTGYKKLKKMFLIRYSVVSTFRIIWEMLISYTLMTLREILMESFREQN